MSEPVVIERSYEVAPLTLFEAWTDVETLTTWWGCGVDQLWKVHVWDPRVGGEIHVSMSFDEGDYEVHGRFIEVVEPSLLVYDWENGQTVAVSIRPEGEGSLMTIEHRGLPERAPDGTPLHEIVSAGWAVSVDNVRRAIG